MIEQLLSNFMSSYQIQILSFIGIFTILAISLDIINGYTGQFSIGHAGFMAVGGYVAAYLTFYHQVPFILATLAGALSAAFFGLLIGIPTLRLRGDYLAIATLGFAEIIRVVLLNLDVVGGARGFAGISNLSNFDTVLIITIISFIVLYNFTRSAYGRALQSIREDEIAAECMGVPTTYFKVLAFVVAAFFAGIAGSLYGHYLMFLHPNDFGLLRSIEILLMIVLGGMGNLWGALLGAIVLSILPESLRNYQGIVYTIAVVYLVGVAISYQKGKQNIARWLAGILIAGLAVGFILIYGKELIIRYAGQMRMIIYSILLILMMIFQPSGLIGLARDLAKPLKERLRGVKA
ncbi:MAG: branched-chain amino acid ABC transporter permease [Actinobacteria bacterium]|nr:branched-chain amino acid ABC transporter permease [Actinomycetota bacterium]